METLSVVYNEVSCPPYVFATKKMALQYICINGHVFLFAGAKC